MLLGETRRAEMTAFVSKTTEYRGRISSHFLLLYVTML
jgi:hypothetical protein